MRPASQLTNDAKRRPELFRWRGGEERSRLDAWARRFEGAVPEDLLSFWESTGGGDLFETETLLSPFGDQNAGDNVDHETSILRQSGLHQDWMVFHVGWGESAFNARDSRIAWFGPGTSSPSREFSSFNQWYEQLLRAEYAARYNV